MSSTSDQPPEGVQTIAIAFPVALLILLLVVALYQFKDSIDQFEIIFWIVILIVPYMVAVGAHFLTQYLNCHKTDSGAAFKGGVATIVTTLIGMGVSSLSWFRIPVASVFAPLLLPGRTTEVTVLPSTEAVAKTGGSRKRSVGGAEGACCTPTRRLEDAEAEYPLLFGISRGFYLFFATMFGIVIGTNVSATC